jgi:hypothetical protein
MAALIFRECGSPARLWHGDGGPDGWGVDDQLIARRHYGGLLCFQASNIVVVLEGGGLEAQRLAVGMKRLAQ